MAVQMMIMYMIGGMGFALLVIVWALKSRQFQEQDRARFLPLRDLSQQELNQPASRRITASVALVFVVLVAGLGALVHLVVRLISLG